MGNEWEDQGPAGETVGMMKNREEKCRPDYEGTIKRLEADKALAQKLFVAVEATVLAKNAIGINKSSLTNLLGILYIKIKFYDETTAEVIAQQEADPEK